MSRTLRLLWNTTLVVALTTGGALAGGLVGRLTCTTSDDAPAGSGGELLPSLDLWEVDCLQYHVLPGAAVGLVLGLVLGLALALRNLQE